MNVAIDALCEGEIHIRGITIKRDKDKSGYWIAIALVSLGSIAWLVAMINDIRT
jgi:hypothetical protein